MDEKTFTGYVPIEELEITYSTSSGPGGQNVNRVHTKVDLRFKLESAKWLPDEVRRKLIDMVSRVDTTTCNSVSHPTCAR